VGWSGSGYPKCITGYTPRRYAMFDQELQESIEAFRAMGAEIELQPVLWLISPQPEPASFQTAVPCSASSNCSKQLKALS
jgi:hypothetical protein